MRHTLNAWEYLKKELKPDIALLQEAPKYPDVLFNNIFFIILECKDKCGGNKKPRYLAGLDG